jgi:hypothetical protein
LLALYLKQPLAILARAESGTKQSLTLPVIGILVIFNIDTGNLNIGVYIECFFLCFDVLCECSSSLDVAIVLEELQDECLDEISFTHAGLKLRYACGVDILLDFFALLLWSKISYAQKSRYPATLLTLTMSSILKTNGDCPKLARTCSPAFFKLMEGYNLPFVTS